MASSPRSRGRSGPPAGAGRDQVIRWETSSVAGGRCRFGIGGHGPPLLFLHGWALGRRAYGRVLEELAGAGFSVFAPMLPGFGGTAARRGEEPSFPFYADWVDEFLEALGVKEPARVVGHSFGGGVAIALAHGHPGRVAWLFLVSAVGAPTWGPTRSGTSRLSERPLWEWGLRLPADLVPSTVRATPRMARDLFGNLARDPAALWSAVTLIRNADLTPQLQEIARNGTRVVAVSGRGDRVVPRACFDELCGALGVKGELVDGQHSWLIAHPEQLAEMVAARCGPGS